MANLADVPTYIRNKSPVVIYLEQHAGERFGKNLQLGDAIYPRPFHWKYSFCVHDF